MQDIDKFWETLESYPYELRLEPHVKNVFKLLGYNSCYSFQNFNSEDISKIETFMRTKYIKILKKKFESNPTMLQSETDKYYGPLWSYLPEEFELMGGELHILNAIPEVARSMISQRLPKSCKGNTSTFLSAPKQSDNAKENTVKKSEADIVLKLKEALENSMNVWLTKNALHLVSGTDEVGEDIVVLPDNFGSYQAKFNCPIPGCKRNFKITRSSNRWPTSNFYSHVEMHIVNAAKDKNSDQPSITSMLSPPKMFSTKPDATSARKTTTDGASTSASTKDPLSSTPLETDGESEKPAEEDSDVPTKRSRLSSTSEEQQGF